LNSKSQKAVTTTGNVITTNGVEDDTEGESVLIGDEEPVVSTLNQISNNKKQSKLSPKSTKLAQHNKHKAAKKSPINNKQPILSQT
jgi:hypothetical protein